ncbi:MULTISPECIES: peptidoglycan DD-metalloendopeptidase family protein [Terrabacteria group]|uniref:peptidoglycan DD-metalloendopeptidase family protein n=1 Tax=Bacillati TaxID=1783272 RepID=UPI001C6F35F7|nr:MULTISPECIES: peptidoglycan DD-metalloendopeptidase family protein [Terrabacteria group]MBW9212618.1 peptidoglycan DD-metalloendopeptidase family protein [Trueperella sp. zg.1013]
MKKWAHLLVALGLAISITICSQDISSVPLFQTQKMGIFNQKVESLFLSSKVQLALYHQDTFVGFISSEEVYQKHLKKVYETKYAQKYPHSHCALGNGFYLLKQKGFEKIENQDKKIFAYLEKNEAYTLETKVVRFLKNGNEYARMYVSSEALYQKAYQRFLHYFVREESLKDLKKPESQFKDYGTKVKSVSLPENTKIETSYALPKDIKSSEEEVLHFLEYGDLEDKTTYIAKQGDQPDGIGTLNGGLSVEQLKNLNPSLNTVSEGQKWNVQYFRSPLEVVVYKEVLKKEEIPYRHEYIYDNSLAKGQWKQIQAGHNGFRNVLYEEKWVNGILVSAKEISHKNVEEAKNALIAINNKNNRVIGTGSYRAPVDNARISCTWACYTGHNGVDFIDAYQRWGKVYASDDGTIEKMAKTDELGNYVVINHHNGYETIYGHLKERAMGQLGSTVKKGDVIGWIGMSGKASHPHVHFSIRQRKTDKFINACDGLMDCKGYLK